MEIGFISDIHSNLPALDAVLDDLQHVDRIFHLGDIVGYNPFPQDVINRITEENIISISGNHDRAVAGDSMFSFPPDAKEIIKWTSNEITQENKEFLCQLPRELQLQIDSYNIYMVHGSPYEINEYIYPTDLTLELVNDLDQEVDILVWGHTHYPVISKINDVLLVNPGSVGQPRDGDWRASYSIFNTQTGDIRLKRQRYNVNETIKKAKAESFPQQIIDSINSE